MESKFQSDPGFFGVERSKKDPHMERDHAVPAPAEDLCHPEVGWGPAARPQNHSPQMVMMAQTEPSPLVRVGGLRGPMERNSTEIPIYMDRNLSMNRSRLSSIRIDMSL